jgi:hypothetical protein
MSNIEHIQNPIVNANLDVQEAQQGGAGSRVLNRLNQIVDKYKTSPTNIKDYVPDQLDSQTAPKQANANEQVDSTEQANAVLLSSKRTVQERTKSTISKKQFSAITTNQPGFTDLHVRSIIESITGKNKLKSLIDTTFKDQSIEQRSFMKVMLIEIALGDPENYGLSDQQIDKLNEERIKLLDKHGPYIENARLALDAGQGLHLKLKISLRQLASAFQIPDFKSSDKVANSNASQVLRVLMAGPNKNILEVIQSVKTHWLNLSQKDISQNTSQASLYRQFIIQKTITQLNILNQAIQALDLIKNTCEKSRISIKNNIRNIE